MSVVVVLDGRRDGSPIAAVRRRRQRVRPMSDRLRDHVFREAPLLHADEDVQTAVSRIVDSGLPALPVVDDRDRLVGVFGEREFLGALFPGYLKQLHYVGFVPKALDEALEKRVACRREPVRLHMTTDDVGVEPEASDVQVAETFLHHRVSVLPVTERGLVVGVIVRRDFFRRLADRFLAGT
jgi:CBS domain-containing protein